MFGHIVMLNKYIFCSHRGKHFFLVPPCQKRSKILLNLLWSSQVCHFKLLGIVPILSSFLCSVIVNVGRAGAASLDVIQEVEYVKQEAKIVYLLECLQKTAPPVRLCW